MGCPYFIGGANLRRSLEQIEQNLVNDDRQLLLMILEQLTEINKSLKLMSNVNEQVEFSLDDNKPEDKRKTRGKKEES